MTVTIIHGDSLDELKLLEDNSIDSVVTDPPYALGFMGKAWDTHTPKGFQTWCEAWAREAFRVLKPGGHLLAFGGTRTYHRLTSGIEDAGFEIRDSLHWLYGSGFPKSHDVSKAIDKAAGAEREVVGERLLPDGRPVREVRGIGNDPGWDRPWKNDAGAREANLVVTAPATDEAKKWEGWGTALKPAHEPIVLARKPFLGTVASNVLTHGTGAINVDGCRVSATGRPLRESRAESSVSTFGDGLNGSRAVGTTDVGRWPANVLLDDAAAEMLDEQSGGLHSAGFSQSSGSDRNGSSSMFGIGNETGAQVRYGDTGGASRFFPVFKYQAKAASKERPEVNGVKHPTVKPVALMRWLVRLVTPAGGTVLDPFAGSGATAEACIAEGMHCIAIEREADYLPLIQQRIDRQQEGQAA